MICNCCKSQMHSNEDGDYICYTCNPTTKVKSKFGYNNKDLMKHHGDAIEETESKVINTLTKTNDGGEILQSTEETLQQRGNRYGEFSEGSDLSVRLRSAILNHKPDTKYPPYIEEAIFMICHKLSRVANGDPLYDDNWRDIAGYAELVVKELNNES